MDSLDNSGSVSTNLSWNVVGGDDSDPSVSATDCLEFAFAPSGATGPYGENVDECRPLEVAVPEGATSVTIAASGAWTYNLIEEGQENGPDGTGDISRPTNPSYFTADLNSQNIIPDSCPIASLEGMWSPVTSPTTLTVAVGDTVAVAGDNETFTVTLSQSVDYSVTVPHCTQYGSAEAGKDYTGTSGTLTFLPGDIMLPVTVPTQLDSNSTDDLNFTLVLGAPSVSSVNVQNPGTATIEKVQAALTIYNPDGTPSNDGTVGVGDSVPMTVRLTSPMAVNGNFTLSYDTDYFKVTTDAAGNDVVTPGVTPITPSTGGTQLYLWGVGATSDPDGSKITLDYGDPEAVGTQNQKVAVVGGKDITPQLVLGMDRLERAFIKLTVSQQLELMERLTTGVQEFYAWDIPTLIGTTPEEDSISTAQGGIVPNATTDATKYTVTVNGGVYYAAAVNYTLYGELMELCHLQIREWKAEIKAYNAGRGSINSQVLDNIGWITSKVDASPFFLKNVEARIKTYRSLKNLLDNAGVNSQLAFAKLGYLAIRKTETPTVKSINWEIVTPYQVPGIVPNSAKWLGALEWRAGANTIRRGQRPSDTGNRGIIDFRQGPTWDDYTDVNKEIP